MTTKVVTTVYTGAGAAGTWSDPANWTSGVPNATGTAILSNSGTVGFGGTMALNTLMLLGSEAVTVTGTLTTTGAGDCKGLMVCQDATMTFAPGATLNDGGVFQVGVHGVGAVTAAGSGAMRSVLNTHSTTLGKFAGAVSGTLTLDDADWHDAGSVLVGREGSGTLVLRDGATATVGHDLRVGLEDGSAGSVTIGAGSTLTVGAVIGIGDGGTHGTETASVTVGTGGVLDGKATLVVFSGASLVLAGGTVSGADTSGTVAVASGGTVSGHGVLGAGNGTAITDAGTITASGGTLELGGSVHGLGILAVAGGATAKIDGASVNVARIGFSGTGGNLALASGAAVTSVIAGFQIGDTLSMAGVDTASWNQAKGTLTLSEQGHTVDTLHLSGSFTGDVFQVQQGSAGAVISLHAH